jgi:hypothetical protein
MKYVYKGMAMQNDASANAEANSSVLLAWHEKVGVFCGGVLGWGD